MNQKGAERVLALFADVRLTPTQRRIAHTLVQHAGAAAWLSAAEVADLAGVSQPSVTRFAMALGHDGYPALRQRLREAATGGPAEAPGRQSTEVQHAVRQEMANLERLADDLDDADRLTAVGALLAGSRPLPVVGLRAAAPLAAYFGFFAAKVLPDVRVLDSGGTLLTDRLEQARAAGATAMLAIVLPRYPREALDALAEARALGLRTVVITDSPVSPAAEPAEVALTARVGAGLVFDLHTAPMTLAMVLLQAICDAVPDQAQRRLEEFESSAARRQVFVP
ncbi:MurR/RpiR family transcriptional regulator [Catenuloplanes atrovinosus]|uniref:DNA-binding MurR/RpiR family transcriptional regulator n=1 Tax=Catenuloplanes atrovinosus TaxID=137266 RepID=A0AAE3YTL0_9ACTN|nr:MurR/RpiR family transcriptional regulator [Catenuloplanes atrovinosus]MDR7278992.1 DNA-binding MurR/RpiR family transcriptional regulator [Catenuloplanes atrovinosus]